MVWSSGDSLNSTNLNNPSLTKVSTSDGSLTSPTYTFTSDNSLGLYYAEAKTVGLAGRMKIYHGVGKDGTPAPWVTSLNTSGSAAGGGWQCGCDDGAAMASGDRLGFVTFQGSEDTASTMHTGAAIEAFTSEAWSATQNGAYLAFKTTANGATARTEVARLTSSSLSLVGELAASALSASVLTIAGQSITGAGTGFSATSIVGTANEVTVTTSGATTTLSVPVGSAFTVAETQIEDGALLARVADGEVISGAWQFTGSRYTFGNPVKVDEVVSNLVGVLSPTLIASSNASVGFGFTTDNYPALVVSGMTLWRASSDRTVTHQSDISMGGDGSLGGRIKLGNGTAALPVLQIGAGVANTGFRYNAGTGTLFAVSNASDIMGWDTDNSDGGAVVQVGSALGNNRLEVLAAEATGLASIYLGGSSSGVSICEIQREADGDVVFNITHQSLTTDLFKLNHPSATSTTGLYLYDSATGGLTEVYVMANSTASGGFRTLAIADS